MKYLLTFLAAALMLTACQSEEEPIIEPDIDRTASRTVIFYVSGENDLSIFAASDTAEIAKGSVNLKDNQHCIAFIDLAEKNIGPSIWEFKGGKRELVMQYEQDFYNSDPRKMKEVLNWIINKYPAKSYGLVLWGHASAWYNKNDSVDVSKEISYYQAPRRSYGRDSGDNTSDSKKGLVINIPSMAQVLENLSAKLDFIFCDCCNMANAATAFELRKSANLLIASPAEIPGTGAPYDKILPGLLSTQSDYYKEVVDPYVEDANNKLPMAVIQLNQMEQFAAATATILQTINPTRDAELNFNNLIYYDGSKSSGVRLLYDIKDFMLANSAPAAYSVWETSLNKTVVYRQCTDNKTWTTSGHVNFDDFKMSADRCACFSAHIPLEQHELNSYSRGLNTYFRKMQWFWAVNWDAYGW